jgi:acetyl-CoA carboxylase biotin carboxyl carrier protein
MVDPSTMHLNTGGGAASKNGDDLMIKPEEIATLVQLFEESQWNELHVELGGMHLFLSTDPNARLTSMSAASQQHPAPVPVASQVVGPAFAAAVAPAKPADVIATAKDGWIAIKAPNLGTFYRAPKPGASPFVEIGQTVDADSEICLLEVMKLFTAVRAGVSGVVRQICVDDADMVEFDQVLFYVEPV